MKPLNRFLPGRNAADPGDRPSNGEAARPAAPALPKIEKKKQSSDIGIAVLGVALGLACALFPWYIFFNQEKFGIKKFVFDGSRAAEYPDMPGYQPQFVRAPFSTGQIPRMDLDLFSTGTLPKGDKPRNAPSDQPFPADLVSFKLVHVANGRAMISDDAGLWVVQPGSQLPDASRVASIEQRNGRWVIVTTLDKVIEMER